MGLEPDHAGGVDHADHDLLFGGRKAGKVGLGADRGEGLAVDGRAIHFIGIGHQGLANMRSGWDRSSAWEIGRKSTASARALRAMAKPCARATSTISAGAG